MNKETYPVTPAVRVLRDHKITFTPHLYSYEEHGGTAVSSLALGVAEYQVIKTLIMEDDAKKPLIVLMRGDKEVSTKTLARFLHKKTIQPCQPHIAEKHSGYQVGGTSPFGTKKPMPIYMEKSIELLEKIYINGGKRGFLVCLSPADLIRVLMPTMVEVAI